MRKVTNGVNILCLDGGGMRGLLEIWMLQAIQKRAREVRKLLIFILIQAHQ